MAERFAICLTQFECSFGMLFKFEKILIIGVILKQQVQPIVLLHPLGIVPCGFRESRFAKSSRFPQVDWGIWEIYTWWVLAAREVEELGWGFRDIFLSVAMARQIGLQEFAWGTMHAWCEQTMVAWNVRQIKSRVWCGTSAAVKMIINVITLLSGGITTLSSTTCSLIDLIGPG